MLVHEVVMTERLLLRMPARPRRLLLLLQNARTIDIEVHINATAVAVVYQAR
jgi:hypothetical protein